MKCITIRFEPSVQSANDLNGGLAHEILFKPILESIRCTTHESRVREDRRKRLRIEPPQFIEERFRMIRQIIRISICMPAYSNWMESMHWIGSATAMTIGELTITPAILTGTEDNKKR